jgi:hypothetical protein
MQSTYGATVADEDGDVVLSRSGNSVNTVRGSVESSVRFPLVVLPVPTYVLQQKSAVAFLGMDDIISLSAVVAESIQQNVSFGEWMETSTTAVTRVKYVEACQEQAISNSECSSTYDVFYPDYNDLLKAWNDSLDDLWAGMRLKPPQGRKRDMPVYVRCASDGEKCSCPNGKLEFM